MKITLKTKQGCADKILIIEGEGPVKEDTIIKKWHEQIIEHMNKLNIVKE